MFSLCALVLAAVSLAGAQASVPQCYKAKTTSLPSKPVVSWVDGSATYQQVFNPSWIEASAGTQGKAGIIIRTQNCSAKVGGPCVHCSGTGQKASVKNIFFILAMPNYIVVVCR